MSGQKVKPYHDARSQDSVAPSMVPQPGRVANNPNTSNNSFISAAPTSSVRKLPSNALTSANNANEINANKAFIKKGMPLTARVTSQEAHKSNNNGLMTGGPNKTVTRVASAHRDLDIRDHKSGASGINMIYKSPMRM